MPPGGISLTIIFFFFFTGPVTPSSTSTSTRHPKFPCKPPRFDSYPFCNTSLSVPARARSLVSHLTLREKIQQLSDHASSVPRLGIPAYEWWSESLHGIASNGPGVSFAGAVGSATTFPQVLLTAAAFNRTLWSAIGSAIATEGRAMYNVGQSGLTFWAPNINIFRDPRWGRGQETPGEDPMVASAYAIEFVKGFQGGGGGSEEDDGLMLSACCKHFTAYDLEKWHNFSRYSFDAVVTQQDLEDTFQPPFRSCIQQGKASCLMCAYNEVNGVPACAMQDLLQKTRVDWGFKGYITSDCDAVATIFEYQHFAKTREEAVADALKAGMDINCGSFLVRNTESAVEQGKVGEEDIDRALLNLFSVQFRLGIFDGDPRKGQFGKLGPKDVCKAEHRTLALEAARQGIVLLKNENNFLPLREDDVASLAIVGPHASNISNMLGTYTGIPCRPKSLFEELQVYVQMTSHAAGCKDIPCNASDAFHEAILAAKKADYVIVVVGLDLTQETEDLDRVSLLLPGKQMDLVSSIAAASKNPIVLVLTGGGPLDVSFAKNDPRIASILWIGYPGEAGGKALAEVIFGDVNPGGRLPVTWYTESFTKVPMDNMNMRADPSHGYPGRTYRFYTGDRVYGYGHGLSFTDFHYKFLSAPAKLTLLKSSRASPYRNRVLRDVEGLASLDVAEIEESCDSLKFRVQISVTNVGDMMGSHVVMLFSRAPRLIRGTPQKQLIGFDRVHTFPNRSTETSMLVDPCDHFSVVSESGKRMLVGGEHVLILGDLEHIVSVELS
ncbi:probable beta-D-xylosidase 6 [Rhodamnia argentea]|uniref:Probable beta-D-xylosidase 6 n=1 Tax=Rhodamnia argentea TaxID=178133 RepID=A0A8B8QMV6_9MYRT|nr:probable beta-D-xylosidase 6 [Rhodamnia argentea]XP_048132849.1 probable beta-D-xylosidase 6 [Rhodamnia argentea]